MSKIVLTDINGGKDLSQINNNFQAIEDELNNKVLYRDNPVGETNSLQTDIDANGKRIINLPDPVSNGEPATKGWAESRSGSAAADAASALASKNAAAVSETNAAASAAAAAHPWAVESGGIHYDGGSVRLGAAGARFLGDFSNATLANRVMFQTSTVNGISYVGVLPNGTAKRAELIVFSSSDPANASVAQIASDSLGGQAVIQSTKTGTGTYLPMTFHTGGSERLRIDTSGNVGVGRSPIYKFDVQCTQGSVASTFTDGAYGTTVIGFDSVYGSKIYNSGATALSFGANNGMNFQITSAGYAKVITATGLGFGTGAGGTVTQTTSRTTSVTIHKPTGSITLVSAAGTTTWQGFIVFNNTVEATDTVILSVRFGMNNIYQTLVQNVQSGGFSIFVSAVNGTTTEAPVINFSVIKGATA